MKGKLHREQETCSGVFVSNNEILTAQHCIDHAKKIFIKDSSGKHYTGIVTRFNKTYDLALIQVVPKNHVYTTIGTNIGITDKVYNVNSGNDIPNTYGEGLVLNKYFLSDEEFDLSESGVNSANQLLIQTSILALSGASGSGLFDSRGRLVGIIVRAAQGNSYAVSTEDVQNFLKY